MTSGSFVICDDPVFIIGSPRSGTSILAWALACHSDLWTSVESDVLYALFGNGQAENAYAEATKRPGGQDWLSQFDVGRDEFLSYLGLGLNALVTTRSEGLRWIDQTPRNTLIADVLARLFPQASFLHILRDGRRVVHSMTHFMGAIEPSRREEWARSGRLPMWASDFRTACSTWQMFVKQATDFRSSHPDRCLTVVNERLVEDTERSFEPVFEFLGIRSETAPSSYFGSHRINSSFAAADSQAPQQLATPWHEWDEEQTAIFDQEAGEAFEIYRAAVASAAQ